MRVSERLNHLFQDFMAKKNTTLRSAQGCVCLLSMRGQVQALLIELRTPLYLASANAATLTGMSLNADIAWINEFTLKTSRNLLSDKFEVLNASIRVF